MDVLMLDGCCPKLYSTNIAFVCQHGLVFAEANAVGTAASSSG